jgi:hypothetical protein
MKKDKVEVKVSTGKVFLDERLRIKQSTLCKMLDVTPQTIRELRESDPSFPSAIKQNNLRQAAIYFDYNEILEWHENLKKAR